VSNYTLYLDEINPNFQYKYFCLAGVAMSDQYFAGVVDPEIKRIKQNIFGDITVNLHIKDIRDAEKETPYQVLGKELSPTRVQFWHDINRLFTTAKGHMYVFGVAVHGRNFPRFYPDTGRDRYFVALQVIMENYVHFLNNVNGFGNILIEQRESTQNDALQQHFYTLKALGTLFYDPLTIQKRLGSIKFSSKADNNSAIQIADMVTGTINRNYSTMGDKKVHNFMGSITENRYDGNIGKPERFGIKVIP